MKFCKVKKYKVSIKASTDEVARADLSSFGISSADGRGGGGKGNRVK